MRGKTPTLIEDGDIRPRVGHDASNSTLYFGVGFILLLGFVLFFAINPRQRAGTPSTAPRAADLALQPQSFPPLYVPPEPLVDSNRHFGDPPAIEPTTEEYSAALRVRPLPPFAATPALPGSQATYLPPAPNVAPEPATSAIVFDAGTSSAEAGGAGPIAAGGTASAAASFGSVRAGRLANRETIVPQGTLIPAVLETAFDSTRPGLARALVSRGISNLAGNRILIPRGSRLFGTYQGEIASGQNRAQIQWNRLVRPDGVVIAIDSPAADRLGRTGIKGRVNTHFLERFGNALLQSSIEIGKIAASRSINDTVIVSFPGNVEQVGAQIVGEAPKPTLTLRQGTRIAVFVARDLDFTAVEGRR